jgi:hypothetical protein
VDWTRSWAASALAWPKGSDAASLFSFLAEIFLKKIDEREKVLG